MDLDRLLTPGMDQRAAAMLRQILRSRLEPSFIFDLRLRSVLRPGAGRRS